MRSLLLLTLLLGACAPPDRPKALVEPLPADLVSWLAPDTARATRIGDGVVHRYLWSATGPWAIHLVEARLDRCDLGLEVVAAPNEPELRGGRATVTRMVEAHPRRVVAAINGDFFTPEGMPVGPEVAGGDVRTRRERDALLYQGGRRPLLGPAGIAGIEGDRTAGPDAWPIDARGVSGVQMVGGYPELLDGGERVGDLRVADNPSFAASRHPRTAVGWDPEEERFWLVVVDGRQGGYSTGMTLPELATLFEKLGVPEALNLDGGGSSVMIARGRTVNRPSDDAGERPVVNALLLVDDAGFCAGRRD